MTNKKIISIFIIALLVLAALCFLSLKANKNNLSEVEIPQDQEVFERTIDVKHQYKDGKHIFAGTLEVPTPCHFVEATINEGEVSELNLEVKDSGEICAQVISQANFYVEHEGPENMLFVGRLNGEMVNLNQFHIDSDIDINDVDIFMKG